jgi:hypothetical protein
MWQGNHNETATSQNSSNEETDPPSQSLGMSLIIIITSINYFIYSSGKLGSNA